MTWTYASSSTAFTTLAKVRLTIGDTIVTDQLLQDEEINQLISQHGTVIKASAAGCRSIAATFSREPDSKVSRVAFSNSQKAEAYLALARKLDLQVGLSVAPWIGAVSRDFKESEQDDDDRVEPAFARGMSDTEDLILDAEVNVGSTED